MLVLLFRYFVLFLRDSYLLFWFCLCIVFLVFGTLFLFSGTFLGYFYIGFVCFCMFLGDLYGVFFER